MKKTEFTDVTRKTAGPTRRTFLAGSGVVAASTAIAGPLIAVPGKAKAAEKLVVMTWGSPLVDAEKEAFFDPFTKETGIPIVLAGAPDLAKLVAQVKTGNVEVDVAELASGMIAPGTKEGIYAPVNYNIVNKSGVIPQAIRSHQIAFYSYAGGIGYDRARHPDGKHPTNWPEFWDVKKIPGRRGLRTRVSEILEIALMGDGVEPSKVYPCDVERGFKALDRIKPHAQWIAETPKTVELIHRNEVDFTYTYNGRVFGFNKNSGGNLGFSRKQNFFGLGYMAAITKAANPDAAQKLLAFLLRPDRQAHFASIIPYPPTIPAAMKNVKGDTLNYLPDPSAPDVCIENIDWWGDKFEELTKRFKEWQIT
jgi:putative spermidine/putrescine transport system substrate-binding protein